MGFDPHPGQGGIAENHPPRNRSAPQGRRQKKEQKEKDRPHGVTAGPAPVTGASSQGLKTTRSRR